MCTQPWSCYVRPRSSPSSYPAASYLLHPAAHSVFRAPLSVCLFRFLNVCANTLPCKDINPNCAWHLSAPTTTTTTTTCRSSLLVFSFCFAFVSLLLLLLLLFLYLVAFLSVSLSAIIRRTKSANILSDTQICKYAAHTQADMCVCECVCVYGAT